MALIDKELDKTPRELAEDILRESLNPELRSLAKDYLRLLKQSNVVDSRLGKGWLQDLVAALSEVK